ncbi:MAG: ATP synthase F1 subunit epsilon [Candidatus Pacebacteria bacterium RIFOXYB1_FULL_44_10]|nr:MAG: ATP synthase F1 subunit epsilon [Candidatus Pacebacteria bacterium RIFOXYB1_FULL_44_10]
MTKLMLTIITQEKELLKLEVDQVTAETASGQITILPNHIPLFTRMQAGELVYKINAQEQSVVVMDGFLDVSPNNAITVLTDSATLARDLSVAQAEEARQKAEEAMKVKVDRRQILMAEASLRKAMLELQVARKRSGKAQLGIKTE